MGVFVDQADGVVAQRAFEPTFQDGGIEEMKIRVGAPEGEERVLVERGVGIANALDIGEVVVVEVKAWRVRAFRDGQRLAVCHGQQSDRESLDLIKAQSRKKRSTMLSQEQPVGVKCMWKRRILCAKCKAKCGVGA